jgi:hypothetical protein
MFTAALQMAELRVTVIFYNDSKNERLAKKIKTGKSPDLAFYLKPLAPSLQVAPFWHG